jgi:hypothetical protein
MIKKRVAPIQALRVLDRKRPLPLGAGDVAIFRLTVGSSTFILPLAADIVPTSIASTSIAMASGAREPSENPERYFDAARHLNSPR